MRRRVVVTGMGVICALGESVEEFWSNCLVGYSPISSIPDHWLLYSNYKSHIWSVLPEIDFKKYSIRRVELLKHDLSSILSLCAAKQAVEQSGWCVKQLDQKNQSYTIEELGSDQVGIYLGTSFGATSFLEAHANQILDRPTRAMRSTVKDLKLDANGQEAICSVLNTLQHAPKYHPLTVSRLMPNAASAVLGIKYSIKGPTVTLALACAASTVAIGHAFRSIRDGYIDAAMAGGSEYWNDYYGAIFRAFDLANTLVGRDLDPHASNRPFDRDRSGFLFSQGGSAILILEELDMARQRGADILAEVLGFSETFDAHNMMSLAPDGAEIERMLFESLKDAKIDPSQIDYINAHGTGTLLNDEVECDVLRRVFGTKPKINSTKSLLGHTIGASGALEAIVTIQSLRKQTTHACKNLVNPISDLNFVREVEPGEFSHACTHSFAFGGHNAGLILGRYRGD